MKYTVQEKHQYNLQDLNKLYELAKLEYPNLILQFDPRTMAHVLLLGDRAVKFNMFENAELFYHDGGLGKFFWRTLEMLLSTVSYEYLKNRRDI